MPTGNEILEVLLLEQDLNPLKGAVKPNQKDLETAARTGPFALLESSTDTYGNTAHHSTQERYQK
jgi:hypothetical protein